MSTKTLDRGSARDRLLAAADELFYEEGVHTVGIDRVIERAGVAKASLYSAFGSKDELIRCYLSARHERRRARMTAQLAEYTSPRERLLGIFDVLGDSFADPAYHGCAFVNASAEARTGSPIVDVVGEYRSWLRALFAELAADAGAVNPAQLAGQLILLYDGAGIVARMDHDRAAAESARAIAVVLVDLALTDRASIQAAEQA